MHDRLYSLPAPLRSDLLHVSPNGACGQKTAVVLDQLLSTYGPDAVLSVIPDLLEDGELVGWIVEVDGAAADGLAVHLVEDADAELRVLMLVQGSQELELDRRRLGAERTGYVDTLRAVQKRLAASA